MEGPSDLAQRVRVQSFYLLCVTLLVREGKAVRSDSAAPVLMFNGLFLSKAKFRASDLAGQQLFST